ncbi:MAG: UDP-3-O-acyl-N-acetylglucosamine deacetylase [Deltaproteobacteria bacterium]|nr:MAG: UDP-3-O-acyl-N-acetylglucosamine deacetylase [Deltaproteobacteria bacterium]
MYFQRTIAEPVNCTGIGLHTGRKVNLTIKPAPVNNGITFIRTDLPKPVTIIARVSSILDTRYATTIGNDGAKVSTVEHLLAAFYGLGIDNARVELDSPEVPIMDGSAAPFIYLIQSANIKEQEKPKKFMVIRKPVRVSDGDRKVSLLPSREFKISYTIDFDHPLLRSQSYRATLSNLNFSREISRARTFGFLQEVNQLRSQGLARGGSLDNAIVIGNFRILNEEELRYPDEFVRHKILDSLGDLSLLQMPVIGHLVAHKSGHSLNYHLIKKLTMTKGAWKVLDLSHPQPLAEKSKIKLPAFASLKQLPT